MMFILNLHLEQVDGEPLEEKDIVYVRRLLHTYDPFIHCGDQFLDPCGPLEPHRYHFWYQTELDAGWENPEDFDIACRDALRIAYNTMRKAVRELDNIRVWIDAQHFPEG